MKKSIITALVVLASQCTYAQLTKGCLVPLVQLDFGIDKSSNTSSTTVGNTTTESSNLQRNNGFNFVPGVGYNLNDKLQTGLYFAIGNIVKKTESSTTTSEQTTLVKNSNWNISPFARFYISSTENLSFFFEGNFRLGQGTGTASYTFKNTTTGTSVTSKDPEKTIINSYIFNINPGAQYMIGNFAIDASVSLFSLGNITNKLTIGNTTFKSSSNVFGFFNSSTPFTVGVKYFLPI